MKKKNKILITLVTLVIFFVGCSSDETNDDSQVQTPIDPDTDTIEIKQLSHVTEDYIMVAAHRGGYKGIAPENSIIAIQNSLNLGVDIIEIDVRLTKDNKLVVIHDNTLNRTTNGNGGVWEHTLEEIQELYLKDESGNITTSRVPTLEEVMTTVGTKAIVFIDKAENVIYQVINVLKSTNTFEQALFMDFIDFEDAKSKYGGVLNKSFYVPGVHSSNDDLTSYYLGFEKGTSPNPSAYAFWYKTEDSSVFTWLNRTEGKNIPVWVNTTEVNQCAGHTDELSLSSPDQGWGWVINNGATILFSDYPTELINYLESINKR